MKKILKYLGLLISISSALVAVPQLLNFGAYLFSGGWLVDLPFADSITHWGGVLNGSLLIPTYVEYYELGIWGFGLIIAGILGVKFGYDLFKSKPGLFHKIIILEIFILAMIIGAIFAAEFSLDYLIPYIASLLPPLAILIFVLLNKKNLSVNTLDTQTT